MQASPRPMGGPVEFFVLSPSAPGPCPELVFDVTLDNTGKTYMR